MTDRQTDRQTHIWIKQGRQQKGDAARTDISRNRAVSKKVTQHGQGRQQKRERRRERLRKTERNFRVFRYRVNMGKYRYIWVKNIFHYILGVTTNI